MEKSKFADKIKQKRIEYGITQDVFSTIAGISRKHLSDIENEKVVVSVTKQKTLLTSLEKMNPNLPLTMIFDYVRIRFKTMDIRHVVEDILRIKLQFMEHMDYGLYGYAEQYYLGNVVIMTSPDEKNGILLELKGRGCRQFEVYLAAQHRTWYDFLEMVSKENGIMKRLDLAINDKTGILDIPELARKCDAGEYISKFKSYKVYHSGGNPQSILREQHKNVMGYTVYIGSFKSEIYFCIYEKDYEQYIKNDIPIENAVIKNRFELRLKDERAEKTVKDLLMYKDAEQTVFSIINHYLRFVDKDDKKARASWKNAPMWEHFIGKNREKLKLTTEPEPYTIERTLNWLAKQVAPTLKVVTEADDRNGTSVIKNMMDGVELKEHHKKLLDQITLSIEDIIIE